MNGHFKRQAEPISYGFNGLSGWQSHSPTFKTDFEDLQSQKPETIVWLLKPLADEFFKTIPDIPIGQPKETAIDKHLTVTVNNSYEGDDEPTGNDMALMLRSNAAAADTIDFSKSGRGLKTHIHGNHIEIVCTDRHGSKSNSIIVSKDRQNSIISVDYKSSTSIPNGTVVSEVSIQSCRTTGWVPTACNHPTESHGPSLPPLREVWKKLPTKKQRITDAGIRELTAALGNNAGTRKMYRRRKIRRISIIILIALLIILLTLFSPSWPS
ncbi:hypothetical protein PT279_01075 [Bifidobacterium sp. ESL0784]|uniref:hypothetical protein n=1 Tax=Bifidobacterium sp. ESL0784 TaxID=2983231 RepID=UPI0023F6FCE1|nr:hypothetical protein [Bifidobacterium sp. ESL0784]MDF7640190.1 hypothetical protein [Bifidobacterium sp. ESL0784]